MTDPKDRFYKARREAIRRLSRVGFEVATLHDDLFDIVITDDDVIRKIKICVDAVPKSVRDQVACALLPASCRRQIWVKIGNDANFQIIRIKPRQ